MLSGAEVGFSLARFLRLEKQISNHRKIFLINLDKKYFYLQSFVVVCTCNRDDLSYAELEDVLPE